MNENFEAARAAFTQGVQAFEGGELARAEALFVESLRHVPGRPSTLANLALVQQRLGRPAEALATVEQATAAAPDDTTAWFHRGQLLQQLERPFEALGAYERVTALDAAHAAAWQQRGSLLKDMGRAAEAAECFRQALAHGGDAELNRYFLASVERHPMAGSSRGIEANAGSGTATPPATAPRRYVEALFDSYAEGFDEHLVGKLGYRTPWLLAQLLLEPPARARRFRSALDLGCGTGLIGPLLAPHCDALDGVDLSSQMLERARALGCYRHLAHAEIVEYLEAHDEPRDLVVAADVLVYIGELQPLFAAVARVLERGGSFAFSVEEAGATAERYELRPSSRYAHGERYLRGLAEAAGFDVKALRRMTLRHEQRVPIGGLLVVMTRPAAG